MKELWPLEENKYTMVKHWYKTAVQIWDHINTSEDKL